MTDPRTGTTTTAYDPDPCDPQCITCDDGKACTDDSCDPLTGDCVYIENCQDSTCAFSCCGTDGNCQDEAKPQAAREQKGTKGVRLSFGGGGGA